MIISLIIIVHELGHIIIALKFGYEIEEVTLLPFGGITKINKDLNTPINKEIMLAFGGIFFQLVLFLIFTFFFHYNLILDRTYTIFKTYNTAIIIFNLIPIVPLDGYIIFKSFLEKILPFKTSFYIANFISILILIIFLIFNYIMDLNNYFIVTFLIYKIILEFKNFKYQQNKFYLERYLNKYNFKKVKMVYDNKLTKMFKDKYHFFIEKRNVMNEDKKLAKIFDKTNNY